MVYICRSFGLVQNLNANIQRIDINCLQEVDEDCEDGDADDEKVAEVAVKDAEAPPKLESLLEEDSNMASLMSGTGFPSKRLPYLKIEKYS